ncbi:unnamed protein product [Rhizoctonia solani]|uniref:Uncharacterized protein n=1 Tax=Rhizoctonia solani TaxID=456999 RepID=A0A8H3BJM6_9AGAM|nr:unnamed protein product [Rhizoctonia solani]
MHFVSMRKRKQILQEYLDNVKQDHENKPSWVKGHAKLHGDGKSRTKGAHAMRTRVATSAKMGYLWCLWKQFEMLN